ncbi:GSCFA domain-containing protein [Algoriphagus sp. H41]|uniref:GSCFA domain-containing protein n=1 Tax=Algoriphagus oliviformis TaxID=2811231 RepID=A0ABS3C699_9BACT|nr:GSCFA domain-containing protein [Algoriphagus oliviformis]MBN7812538.1 GSCFA domain-containing protein [Algoriphagus oliviformis]
MRWSIDFPIPASASPIPHSAKILSLGSCFAQTIGMKMRNAKFDILVNPFGTIFHPLSLVDLISQSLSGEPINPTGILERDGLYLHYSAHSDLREKSAEALASSFQAKVREMQAYLQTGDFLILTLGTAWLYEHQELGRVANCHKQPQKLFAKRLTELKEMQAEMEAVLEKIHEENPRLQVILTVSPVRHIKDGVAENQLSKSLLRVLCGRLEAKFAQVSYFPAYEVMMDELRDYRFYKPDLIHPSEEAEDYIWKRWRETHFSPETQKSVTEIEKIGLELAHRPFNPDTEAHGKFLRKLLEKLERLNGQFDFSKEIEEVTLRLRSG